MVKYIVTYGKKERRIVLAKKGKEFRKFNKKITARRYGNEHFKGKNPRVVKIKWM